MTDGFALSFPKITVAQLRAADFTVLATDYPNLQRDTWHWLAQLHGHPTTPTNAKRARLPDGRIILDAGVIEATCAPTWWRVVAVKLDDHLQPIPDPDAEPGMFLSIKFEPAIEPPPELARAIDAMSGHKLTNRVDGGPKPEPRRA